MRILATLTFAVTSMLLLSGLDWSWLPGVGKTPSKEELLQSCAKERDLKACQVLCKQGDAQACQIVQYSQKAAQFDQFKQQCQQGNAQACQQMQNMNQQFWQDLTQEVLQLNLRCQQGDVQACQLVQAMKQNFNQLCQQGNAQACQQMQAMKQPLPAPQPSPPQGQAPQGQAPIVKPSTSDCPTKCFVEAGGDNQYIYEICLYQCQQGIPTASEMQNFQLQMETEATSRCLAGDASACNQAKQMELVRERVEQDARIRHERELERIKREGERVLRMFQ